MQHIGIGEFLRFYGGHPPNISDFQPVRGWLGLIGYAVATRWLCEVLLLDEC